MSLILSIETATKVCSVALHKNGELLSHKNINRDYSHFEKLPGLIASLFEEVELEIRSLDAVSVSKGPGSYTGLRIGVSMAKGIAFAQHIPLIAVDTLLAMAVSAKKSVESTRLLCPMIDARRSEVYCTILDYESKIIWPVQALIVSINTFESITKDHELVLFGDGSLKFKTLFKNSNTISFLDIEPDARTIGQLAWDKFLNNDFEDIAYFEPYYLKDFTPGLSKKPLTL